LDRRATRVRPGAPVFLDKAGTSTNLAARRQTRLPGDRPGAHAAWNVVTFLAGLRRDGITAPFVIDRHWRYGTSPYAKNSPRLHVGQTTESQIFPIGRRFLPFHERR